MCSWPRGSEQWGGVWTGSRMANVVLRAPRESLSHMPRHSLDEGKQTLPNTTRQPSCKSLSHIRKQNKCGDSWGLAATAGYLLRWPSPRTPLEWTETEQEMFEALKKILPQLWPSQTFLRHFSYMWIRPEALPSGSSYVNPGILGKTSGIFIQEIWPSHSWMASVCRAIVATSLMVKKTRKKTDKFNFSIQTVPDSLTLCWEPFWEGNPRDDCLVPGWPNTKPCFWISLLSDCHVSPAWLS